MKYDIILKLKIGYERIRGFESATEGYEWFGNAPGNEALTAYGIALLNDMKKVVNFVDDAALERNMKWLMGRKDPKKVG